MLHVTCAGVASAFCGLKGTLAPEAIVWLKFILPPIFVLWPVGSLFLISTVWPTEIGNTCERNLHSFWSKTTSSLDGWADSCTRDAVRRYKSTFLIPLVLLSTTRYSCSGAVPCSVQISGSLLTL